jgi:hypothetical protein
MKRIALLGWIAAVVLASSPAPAATPGQWIHVTVDERGPDGETVRINLPIELLTKVLPLIHHENLAGGKVKVNMGDEDFSAADLRAAWEAVRSSRDGNYVTVDGPREKVRVAKRGEFLLVQVNDDKDKEKQETVEVKLPLAVVDALLSGKNPDELDLAAAIEALARHAGSGDLVTVKDGDSNVRIWIDSEGGPE